MWQSWQPAPVPVWLTACTLARYSFATHCIEWQAVLQNSLVPVASIIAAEPTVPTKPITMPATRSVSRDHFALGVRSVRQVRFTNPSAKGPPLKPVVHEELQDVRAVPRLRIRAIQVRVLVRRARHGVLVTVHLRVAVFVALVGPSAGERPCLVEGVDALEVERLLLGVVPGGDRQRPDHGRGHALLQRQVYVAVGLVVDRGSLEHQRSE